MNASLADHPEYVNTDPYGKGWLIKLKTTDQSGLNALMDAKTYDQKYGG